MKVLALNSSPRKEGQSKTELILTHLVNGMQDAGAEVETVHLRKKTVRYCAGCFSCWTKTPGQLSAWVQSVYGRAGAVVAEIYRPAAETMTTPYFQDKTNDILAATTQAGREIVESMRIQPETMKRIKQVIAGDKAMSHQMGNLFWKTCIAEGVTPKEFSEKGFIPRPDSIESFMIFLLMGFNAEAAGDISATIQFKFDGDAQRSCHFDLVETQRE